MNSCKQMNEEELLVTHHVGDVINVIQRSSHHLFDPDELLTVTASSFEFPIFFNFIITFVSL